MKKGRMSMDQCQGASLGNTSKLSLRISKEMLYNLQLLVC